MTVTHINFGKDKRDIESAFARMIDGIEKLKASVLADPWKYFQVAQQENARLSDQIRDMRAALQEPPILAYIYRKDPPEYGTDTVTIQRRQFENLMAAAERIEKAFSELK